MSRRAKKLPSVLRDYEFKLQEEAVGQARGPSIVISACRLIMHSLRCLFVCIAAKPTVSIVFTDDGVRKTVSERKFQQLTEEDGSCPNPNVVYEGQKLFCWHTPSKTRFPCIVLRVDWKNDGECVLINSSERTGFQILLILKSHCFRCLIRCMDNRGCTMTAWKVYLETDLWVPPNQAR